VETTAQASPQLCPDSRAASVNPGIEECVQWYSDQFIIETDPVVEGPITVGAAAYVQMRRVLTDHEDRKKVYSAAWSAVEIILVRVHGHCDVANVTGEIIIGVVLVKRT
jgi:hypothetical protein